MKDKNAKVTPEIGASNENVPAQKSGAFASNANAKAVSAPQKGGALGARITGALGSPLLLVLCLVFGLGCRFYGLNWDEGAQLHPDERFCASVVERLRFPDSVAQFFDSRRSPLNPATLDGTHYVYGQLPLFVLKIAAQLTGKNSAPQLWIVGRFLSALFDCGTVALTFLIARRFFDLQKSLFCAVLVACAALHIQQSHFFVVDPFAAFFLTASFWAGARLVQSGRARDALWLGAFFGAALACKISAALFVVALLGFLVLLARHGFKRTSAAVLVMVLATGLVFRLGQPMAFRGEFGFFDVRPEWMPQQQFDRQPDKEKRTLFWNDLAGQGGITNGTVDVPFDVQWIGRAPLLFSARNLGFWGYGWPFLLSAGAGLVFLTLRPRGKALLVVAAFFALALFGVQGAAFSKFTRYFLPLTPFCALLAAHFWRKLEQKRVIFRLGAPLVALFTAGWALCVTSIYGRAHSRIAASRWIETGIPAGTVVANETAWDEGLPLGNVGVANTLEARDLDLYALDTPEKTAALLGKLDEVQWIFISSGRGWQNIPRWSEKWPVTTEYYRALFDGRLGFRLEKRFDSFPRLGPFQFPDASAEEALTVYDHPVVWLFRKTKAYDSAQTRQILEAVAPPNGQGWQPNQAPAPDERSLPVPPGY